MSPKHQNDLVILTSILIAVTAFLTLSFLTLPYERMRWNMTYTIGARSYPYSVQQTPDNGYIITGCTMQTTSGIQQIFLLKTNSTGSQEWLRTYGDQWAYGYSVRTTRDGGYIVAGACNGTYILKTNSTGGIQWSRNYDAIRYANSIIVIEGASEGYLVSETGNGYSVRLLMLDSLGNVLWSSSLGNEHLPFMSQDSSDNGLQATRYGGYVIVGGTVLDDKGVSVGPNGNVVLFKTDSRGKEIWNMTYGGDLYERGTSIQVTPCGGYVIMGFSLSPPGAVYLFKTDSSGYMLWNRTYINEGFDGSVSAVPDEGYIVVGSNMTKVGLEGLAFEIDGSGNIIWRENFGNYLVGCGSVRVTTDGGYIVAGKTVDDKIFLIKR